MSNSVTTNGTGSSGMRSGEGVRRGASPKPLQGQKASQDRGQPKRNAAAIEGKRGLEKKAAKPERLTSRRKAGEVGARLSSPEPSRPAWFSGNLSGTFGQVSRPPKASGSAIKLTVSRRRLSAGWKIPCSPGPD
jgi:hypothetical protein